MYRMEPEPSELKAASLVAEVAQLLDVRFGSIEARVSGDVPFKGILEPTIEFETEDFCIKEPDRLLVKVRLRFSLKAEAENPPADKAQAKGDILLHAIAEYLIPPEPVPEVIKEKGLPPFAKYNGLYNCWPYLRQELQAITLALGLPAFVLPPLLIRAKKPSEPEKSHLGSQKKTASTKSAGSIGPARARKGKSASE